MLQCCVRLSVMNVLWLNGASKSKLLDSEAVWSAILATAWLVVVEMIPNLFT